MKRRFLIVTLVTALMISAVGCGGSGKNDNKETTTSQAEQKEDSAQDKDKNEGKSEAPGKAPGRKCVPNGTGVNPGTAVAPQGGAKVDAAGHLVPIGNIVMYNNVPLNIQSAAQANQVLGGYSEGELIDRPCNMLGNCVKDNEYDLIYINGAFRTMYIWSPKAVVADGLQIGMTLGQLKSTYGLPPANWVANYDDPFDGVSIFYQVTYSGKEYMIRLDFSDNNGDSQVGDDATLYEIQVYDSDIEAAFPDNVIWE
ncbi:MAG: hypothetical protein K5769_01795 [Pseudobutyrivibrio sp.]|nr:hypothetical protein [Pseudobutyrivibrio sp.]